MQTIVDPNLVHKLVSLFMNYYIISDCFRAKTQASLNFILKRSIGIEVILNCLRLSPNEMKVIEAIFMTLLFETVEYSRLKPILLMRLENSSTTVNFCNKWIECLHSFTMSVSNRQIVHLKGLEDLIKVCRENYFVKASPRSWVLVPNQVFFSSYYLTSPSTNLYRWDVYQIDDLRLDSRSKKYHFRAEKTALEEETSLISPRKLEEEPEQPRSIFKQARASVEDLYLTGMLEIKQKKKSSISFDSSKNLKFITDELENPAHYTPINSATKKSYRANKKAISQLEADSIDEIFRIQSQIEADIPAETADKQACYQSSKAQFDCLSPQFKCRLDDQHIYFYGLAKLLDSGKDHANLAAMQLAKLYKPETLIFSMKCYSSNYSLDAEWRNLVKALGVRCDSPLISLCRPSHPAQESANEIPDPLVLKSSDGVYYSFINNDIEMLKQGMTDLENEQKQKNQYLNHLSFLILFGSEADVMRFREEHFEVMKSYQKIILITKTFDLHVVQMQVIKVPSAHQLLRGLTAKKQIEKQHTRELVNIGCLDRRIRLLVLESLQTTSS